MLDKTNLFLCLILATLLYIIYFIPGPRQSPSPSSKVDSGIQQEVSRFQDGVKKFVKSLGDMEQRLQKLEDIVEQIHKKQESFHVNLQKDENVHVPQNDVNLDVVHEQEVSFENFVGEIKRENYCFDSAEHSLDGVVEIWQCHKKGRNQEFQTRDGTIAHKNFCLGVEKAEEGESVVLKECNNHNSIMEWQYQNSLIKAGNTNYCMMNNSGTGAVTLARCNVKDKSQQWQLARA